MRLVIRRESSLINDLRFDHGPIYIGSHRKSQVFLPDRGVSRQHAVPVSLINTVIFSILGGLLFYTGVFDTGVTL